VSAEHQIAIIDDDRSLRMALARLVRSLGYKARDFASAEAFLNSGALGDFVCVVTDIHMPPGMSGIDLKLHLAAVGCPVPVIMITARTEERLEDAAMASGAACILRKPFEASAFSDCLAKVLLGQVGKP
jgi:FixJ family two-component response regulator